MLDPRDLPALHAYAREIARELGAPWRYDQKESRDRDGALWHHAALMPGLTEYGVNVRVDYRRPDRIELSGRIPSRDRLGHSHYTHQGSAPKVTVALERGPKAAARAILTRLVPAYEPVYAKAKGYVDRANRELSELERVTALLEPYGRLSPSSKTYGGSSEGRFYLHQADGMARFVASAGRVRLEISVLPETAVEILRLAERDPRESFDV